MSDGSAIATNRFSIHSIDWLKAALLLLLTGLIIYAYWFQPVEHTLTCYRWLIGHWSQVSN